MFTFGTTSLDKHDYSTDDLKRLVPISHYGLDASFYGGRVTHIGETDSDILLLIDNREQKVVDVGAINLENIHIKHIRNLCEKRKIDTKGKTKDELIELLGR